MTTATRRRIIGDFDNHVWAVFDMISLRPIDHASFPTTAAANQAASEW